MPILDGRPCAKKLFDRKAIVALQTDLYKEVGRHWGLERGQEGSQAEHLNTVEFKLKKMQEAGVAAQRQADDAEERTLLAEQNASIAEQRQAHAEERTADLFKQQERQDEDGIAIQHEGSARALSGIAAGGEEKRGTATKRRPSAGDQAARARKT